MGKKSDNRKYNGGARVGAGRKSVNNKLLPVTIYVAQSVIASHGGIDDLKSFLRAQVNEPALPIAV